MHFYYCDRIFLDQFKQGVIIINTSTGMVVNTKDLIQGLESGQVGGACLDIFENEKVHTFSEQYSELYHKLTAMSNVVLTPHVAGWTRESKGKIAHTLIKKIARIKL